MGLRAEHEIEVLTSAFASDDLDVPFLEVLLKFGGGVALEDFVIVCDNGFDNCFVEYVGFC